MRDAAAAGGGGMTSGGPAPAESGGPQQVVGTAVDVQDMLCAQALAVVASVVKALPAGGVADVRYNAADVKNDLVAWARQVGHCVEEFEPGRLRVTRREGMPA